MQLSLEVKAPFSFAQAVAFLRRFPPCQGEYVLRDDAITAAVSVGGIAKVFTIREQAGRSGLKVDVPRHSDVATQRALLARAADFLGVNDDVAPFYAAAEDDPHMRSIVRGHHGLHHVRFLTLPEIAVYSVMMQRTPMKMASVYKRRFLTAFGIPVDTGEEILRAMPELDQLGDLSASEINAAIDHAHKAAAIVEVVRGVAAIGEAFLREAPYEEARDALLEVPHIGPFSAAAILLRGLGRMNQLPSMAWFEDEARFVYGHRYDADDILARYGEHVGYWSFYLKASTTHRLDQRTRDAAKNRMASSARAA